MSAVETCYPGEYLRDELLARGITQRSLAEAMARPEQAVSEIINGKKQVTADTALDLEAVLGVSAVTWVNLQAAWDLEVARSSRVG